MGRESDMVWVCEKFVKMTLWCTPDLAMTALCFVLTVDSKGLENKYTGSDAYIISRLFTS